jgi:hypothetical protein
MEVLHKMQVMKPDMRRLEETTLKSQRITVSQYVGQNKIEVAAPLPDNFGLTVGSEFATPFDTSTANSLLSKALYLSDVAQKVGMRMKKYYSAPTPTEISFDMEFTSYYNAYGEVVVPAVLLMQLSLGRRLDLATLEGKIRKILDKIKAGYQTAARSIDKSTNGAVDFNLKDDLPELPNNEYTQAASTGASKAMDLFGFVSAPETSVIRFGDVFTLETAYITHVGVKFSNILDTAGMPTSCVCAITATLEQYPVAEDILDMFGGAK